MPKKVKAKKNSKISRNAEVVKRTMIYANPDYHVYGTLEKALGARFFNVKCLDGATRRCKVRQKRLKVKEGDLCIISLREFEIKVGDIIHKYDSAEVRRLVQENVIPSMESLSEHHKYNDNLDDDDEDTFVFEDL